MTATTTDLTLRNLKSDDLQQLAEAESRTCVSILMPTHRKGHEAQQDPIRFSNLLSEASAKLSEAGHDPGVIKDLESLKSDAEFWRHQGDGLAIFISIDQCHLLRLNRPVDEAVYIGGSFFISPLARECNVQHKFFVLALSWDESTLYQADGEKMTTIQTELLPAKFDQLVLPRDPEESLQSTSHTAGRASVAVFHGHGEGEDKIDADRDQYLSIVAEEVSAAIYNSGMPLVVAATTEVAGHFGAKSKVQIDAQVSGSPSTLSEQQLQQSAKDAVAPMLGTDFAELRERFGTAQANSQASTVIKEIAEAAENGRVDSLMICDSTCEKTNAVVRDTIRHGGSVYRCREDELPGRSSKLAAILRY